MSVASLPSPAALPGQQHPRLAADHRSCDHTAAARILCSHGGICTARCCLWRSLAQLSTHPGQRRDPKVGGEQRSNREMYHAVARRTPGTNGGADCRDWWAGSAGLDELSVDDILRESSASPRWSLRVNTSADGRTVARESGGNQEWTIQTAVCGAPPMWSGTHYAEFTLLDRGGCSSVGVVSAEHDPLVHAARNCGEGWMFDTSLCRPK